MQDTLYILDGHSYIYRAFYAVKDLKNSKGLPTNAIYGFTKMLLKIIEKKKPKYFVACFDSPGPSKRVEELLDYKANRQPMPEDLSIQIPFILKIVEDFNIPICMKEGIEADDLIASYCSFAKKEKLKTVIITGDKDLMQLVDDESGISMWDTMKDVVYDRKEVKKKMGVFPESIPDLLGLMGDTSDNIPGVKGIGPKTASEMLEKYPHIELIYEHLDEVAKGKTKEKMEEGKDNAYLSKLLATVIPTIELPHSALNEILLPLPNYEALFKTFDDLEFKNIIGETKNPQNIKSDQNIGESEFKENIFKSEKVIVVDDDLKIQDLIEELKNVNEIAFDTETDSVNSLDAGLVGIALSCGYKTWYLPYPSEISKKLWDELFKILSKKILIAHNAKFDFHVIENIYPEFINFDLKVFDTSIAAFLLDPEGRRYKLSEVCDKYMEGKHNVGNYIDVIGDKPIKEVSIDVLSKYAGEDARGVFELKKILELKLKKEELLEMANLIEMPLIRVLTKVEEEGILVDTKKLSSLEKLFTEEIKKLEIEIFKETGSEFNISSPAQLQEVLFSKLKLNPGKKTKTGFSTDERVLRDLSSEHHVPKLILQYRHLSKLLSTYILKLPESVNKYTGRVHTTFNQTGAATGRFSSTDPNLQNIPIRSEFGEKIRECFIAKKDYKLASLDYSQIELRILAHETKEKGLLDAFKNGKDIHSATASIIFEKESDSISRDERSIAKTINFGLMYGMGPFKLAGELGIPRSEAREFIDKYFKALPNIKTWKEEYIQNVYETGFAKTFFGRKRYFPNIRSENKMMEEASKREAINFVFQGTNADIIKLAMVKIDRFIEEKNLKTRMILQVHDELVFEFPPEEEDYLKNFKEIMEKVIVLDVPIVVEIGVGNNWLEAH